MIETPSQDKLIERELRKADACWRRRTIFDRGLCYFRSCAVCATPLPPIDLLCTTCWRKLGHVMNRAEKLRQGDYPFPTYSLLTWTPSTEAFVKPLIYGFKNGFAVGAAQKLAALFLSERLRCDRTFKSDEGARSLLLSAPGRSFDHSKLWAKALGLQIYETPSPALEDVVSARVSQKQLRQSDRSDRRFQIREQFANHIEDVRAASSVKRIVFADDVITSGSTAMAAYMGLGDPDGFEVWTLVSRPRLAAKVGIG